MPNGNPGRHKYILIYRGMRGTGDGTNVESILLAFLPVAAAGEVEVVVSPRVTVVERDGITGGGCPVKVGDRVLSFYPNHPDDFGGSKGMASAISTDGGMTWTKGRDNWPISGMIALWAERMRNGMAAAGGRLCLSTRDGGLLCFE